MTGRAFGRAFGPLQHASRADSTSSQQEFEEDGGDDRGDEISASVGSGNGYGGVGVLPSHPRYREEGRLINVEEGNLLLSREGEPRLGEISNSQLLKILEFGVNANMCTDLEVNTILWKCLGYRFVDGEWNNEMCFPNWKEKYPTPPDFIGMQRIYSKEIDNPSLKANQALCKTIPVHAKQSLKDNLRSYGFTGFKLADLTPNKTRRAQSCNWLLYYRDNLFGKTIEDLINEKEERRVKEEEERRKREEEGGEEPWSPPVNPVV
ncbi:hypothetical protein TrVE_jg4363 [Triparma verrucosa]|uniref:Uncharacterized protein n=1 Tax=Triparma verrucosa TaxID=1606542 RepID=A0A9W7KXU4_9STRA|nr:hypothetical protein TrVE_jg4363 [Triparma verrucosa]